MSQHKKKSLACIVDGSFLFLPWGYKNVTLEGFRSWIGKLDRYLSWVGKRRNFNVQSLRQLGNCCCSLFWKPGTLLRIRVFFQGDCGRMEFLFSWSCLHEGSLNLFMKTGGGAIAPMVSPSFPCWEFHHLFPVAKPCLGSNYLGRVSEVLWKDSPQLNPS